MGPGTAQGEIALVDGGPRSATVVADEPSAVHSLAFAALAELGSLHPELATGTWGDSSHGACVAPQTRFAPWNAEVDSRLGLGHR
jgi:hypothetical protein